MNGNMTKLAVDSISEHIQSLLVSARFELDGEVIERELYSKEINENNNILVLVYLSSEDTGTLTNLEILNENGEVIISSEKEITKTRESSLLTGFLVHNEVVELGMDDERWNEIKEIMKDGDSDGQ